MLLYFSVFRESDGYECASGFTTGSDTVRDYVRYMRERIDEELASDDPWDERWEHDRRAYGEAFAFGDSPSPSEAQIAERLEGQDERAGGGEGEGGR